MASKPPRFLICDRDAKLSGDVISIVKQNGTEPVRTASVSPHGNKIISSPRLGGLHHRYTVAA